MKTRFVPTFSPSIILRTSLLVLLSTSCAPAAVASEPSLPQPAAPNVVGPTATAFLSADPVTAGVTEVAIVPTEANAPTPFPVATSRGPNLEATDPRGVNLASGGLQFVEFFRFT